MSKQTFGGGTYKTTLIVYQDAKYENSSVIDRISIEIQSKRLHDASKAQIQE